MRLSPLLIKDHTVWVVPSNKSYFMSDTSKNEGIFSWIITPDIFEDDVFLSSSVTSIGEPDTRVSPDSREVYFFVMRRFFGFTNGALSRGNVS